MAEQESALRMLIVDDEPFVQRLLATMLAQLGYRNVVTCSSGTQALQQLTRSVVDVLFLDVNMPGMDGVELIRLLAQARYCGLVVPVSGEDSRILESVNRLLSAHQLKSAGCLEKPVSRARLESLLQSLKPKGSAGKLPGAAPPGTLGIKELHSLLASGTVIAHYQPQVSLTSGALVGVETLARLRDASGATVMPNRFIAVAEEYGLIREITRRVLQCALEQAKAWREAGLRVGLAVNVSMDDLAALDFPDMLDGMANALGVEPQSITLEVTESRVLQQLSTVLDVLSRLRLKRFRLSIDDFGTGHSSLAQLRDLPFDELKIDRGFVDGASHNCTLRAICEANVRMAKQLSMSTVAEGIETQADYDVLRDLGCDAGQGYLMARPMPGEELLRWARERAQRAARDCG
ncbi:MAG TPA: EAL domain-containing response regulator [Steroidobacteraceae bacterium]|nr:EAL domain-containing response regulator [Steroidobacteraceae bacterium]